MRRRGRPRMGARFDVRLPEAVMDRLCVLACRRGQSLAEITREVLARHVGIDVDCVGDKSTPVHDSRNLEP